MKYRAGDNRLTQTGELEYKVAKHHQRKYQSIKYLAVESHASTRVRARRHDAPTVRAEGYTSSHRASSGALNAHLVAVRDASRRENKRRRRNMPEIELK